MTADGASVDTAGVRHAPAYRSFLANYLSQQEAGRGIVERSGFLPDEILAEEARGGRPDGRYGVNIVARPPESVVALIRDFQSGLRRVDPRQYFYPASDLHLTILEIRHGHSRPIDAPVVARIASAVRKASAEMPAPQLADGRVGFDGATVTLHGFPGDERLQRLRERMIRALEEARIPFEPRYRRDTAHVTFVRYLEEVSDPAAWARHLRDFQERVHPMAWDVEAVHVTAGATWYGRSDRLERFGPFPLRRTRQAEP
jgi:2'-5' RNA ligase